ncbi:hypothetical protein AQS8620_01609 [Aquimixticola soesokkakensis]|uniref:Class I SAM-dependent methyltransferase n=1 Tax=Aquimixticola soesokkakensis TaxID=1519096 RepID=A0A1Y5SIG6_9RHOB|nr:hypothetical protein [Aquimixticola soesokkakensis]SLN41590.1 hypothetical protein AQS8620_01609 [Aquimixticola soesokkakensis]
MSVTPSLNAGPKAAKPLRAIAKIPPEGPPLTFVPEVAQWVRAHYERASVILEYGSGGSTALAAGMAGKTVFSVENARKWHNMMRKHFERHPPAADLHLHLAPIGPTKDWGFPETTAKWRSFCEYPLGVWGREDFKAPDLVLIDGRFRAGCFLAVLLESPRPVTVLFDDYAKRAEEYAICESFAPIVERRGDMVKFELSPQSLPRGRLLEVIKAFQRAL